MGDAQDAQPTDTHTRLASFQAALAESGAALVDTIKKVTELELELQEERKAGGATTYLRNLRDHFAAVALGKMLEHGNLRGISLAAIAEGVQGEEYLARQVYSMADAMMAAREKVQNPAE